MMLELIAAALAGLLIGIVSGLTPGLHVNLAAAIFVHATGGLPGLVVAVALVGMSFAHVFLEFVPAVFLSAASEDTAMASKPAAEMLMKGLGYDAVRLALTGCLAGFLAAVLLLPGLLLMVPLVFAVARDYIGWVLLFFAALMLWMERRLFFWAVFVFAASGALGFVAFSLPGLDEPLLPMLSGLFAVSFIVMSLAGDFQLPVQHAVEIAEVKPSALMKQAGLAIAAGSLISIFPALGPAQSASVTSSLSGSRENKGYVVLVGAVASVSMFMSLVTMYTIAKARNGSVAMAQDALGIIGIGQFSLLLAAAFLSAGLSVVVAVYAARLSCRVMAGLNYRLLLGIVASFILLLVFLFSGLSGLVVMLTGASIGITCIVKGLNRSLLMGCLMAPVMAIYL
ncbi:tripartite tricarboxylate transporter permease [Candidatus Woesearchaeota archaeon]|nr:tripartite tricarboxylate transporter permease [Candidatus Woesearchaeota archaeon]